MYCVPLYTRILKHKPSKAMPLSPKKLLCILILLQCFSGCSYFKQPSIPEYAPAIQQEAARYLEQRKAEALQTDLATKATIFEARIFSAFKAPKHHLFGERLQHNQALILDLEATALLLANMAAKYQCTQAPDDLIALHKIQEGLLKLDALNGLDGFLPYQVNAATMQITNGRTHSNAYAQLMFAYVLIAQKMPNSAAHLQVVQHADYIATYFLKYGFEMHDAQGEPIEFSNLAPKRWQLSRSRNLDFLVIAESLRALLPIESPHQVELERHIQEAIRVGYLKKIQRLSFQFLDIRIPTDGSDWLNMIRLYTLVKISERKEYKSAFDRLYKKQKKEKNPFFAILYKDRTQQAEIRHYLASFPLTLNNQLILPSDAVELKQRSPFIKHSRKVEATVPQPLYQRPSTDNMWKNNPFRVHGGQLSKNPTHFSGSDYTLTYWLGRMHGLL